MLGLVIVNLNPSWSWCLVKFLFGRMLGMFSDTRLTWLVSFRWKMKLSTGPCRTSCSRNYRIVPDHDQPLPKPDRIIHWLQNTRPPFHHSFQSHAHMAGLNWVMKVIKHPSIINFTHFSASDKLSACNVSDTDRRYMTCSV